MNLGSVTNCAKLVAIFPPVIFDKRGRSLDTDKTKAEGLELFTQVTIIENEGDDLSCDSDGRDAKSKDAGRFNHS